MSKGRQSAPDAATRCPSWANRRHWDTAQGVAASQSGSRYPLSRTLHGGLIFIGSVPIKIRIRHRLSQKGAQQINLVRGGLHQCRRLPKTGINQ